MQHPRLLGWHLELHIRPAFLHEHTSELHLPPQWHFTIPCPPVSDTAAEAVRTGTFFMVFQLFNTPSKFIDLSDTPSQTFWRSPR